MNKTKLWFPGVSENGLHSTRLFCFPHAGGGASQFSTWRNVIPPAIELCPVRLPGRETRIRESALNDITELVKEIIEAIVPLLDRSFAFFGHSMGALVAFETAGRLMEQESRIPVHLFVSGARAPQCASRESPIADLAEEAFVAAIRQRFGPNAFPDVSPEFARLIAPTLRADFRVIESYRFASGPPLPCPITAFSGTADEHVTTEELADWRAQTTRSFSSILLPGDHFFAYAPDSEVPRHMGAILNRATRMF